MSKIEIFSTLGPASLNPAVIKRLDKLGVSLFRINLSHTKLEDLSRIVNLIRNFSEVPICLDTEGGHIRTGSIIEDGVYLSENSTIKVSRVSIIGDHRCFNLYPHYIFDQLREGDILTVGFESLILQITDMSSNYCNFRVLIPGMLQSNKGARIDRQLTFDPLTEKDRKALEFSLDNGINTFALSFVNSKHDVEEVRLIIGNEKRIISKIESMEAIKNLNEICLISNGLLIDRGDLSGDVALDQLPIYQKKIILTAKQAGKKIYVATNLLESMVEKSVPTRAEVSDVYHILLDGADGLVLAAETAIGKYPVQCALMIKNIIDHFIKFNSKDNNVEMTELYDSQIASLVRPHGGNLVNSFSNNDSDYVPNNIMKIEVDADVIMDSEQIATGAFSPIEGFMDKETINSVLYDYQLPNGTVWTMPIVLQIPMELKSRVLSGDRVALVRENSKEIYSIIQINQVFEMNLPKMSKLMFNTDDLSHPGVKRLFSKGNLFIGGKVKLKKRFASNYKYLEMTPSQTRALFYRKGWSRIIGFHTRNVPHRVHEFIQLNSMEEYNCDGILVHPIIGRKKIGDFSSDIILESYKIVLEKYYPSNSYHFAAFQSYPRYCGPREAVFTAICRKNFGCSHFIIGRDHTGVDEYYKKDNINKLLDSIGDIGMEIIHYDEMEYCSLTEKYVIQDKSVKKGRKSISGSTARKMLKEGISPPDWFMRSEVSDLILNSLNEEKFVFVED